MTVWAKSKTDGSRAKVALWMSLGGLGLVFTLAILRDGSTPNAAWVATLGLSVALFWLGRAKRKRDAKVLHCNSCNHEWKMA